MHKSHKKTVTILIVFILMSLFCCVPVFAANAIANMSISQPNVSDDFSYIEVSCYDSSSAQYYHYVILISVVKTTNSTNSSEGDLFLTVSNSKSLSYSCLDGDYSVSAVAVSSLGTIWNKSPVNGRISHSFEHPIVSIIPYGRISYNDIATYNTKTVDFVYGADNVSTNLLKSILSVLQNQSNSDIVANQNQNAQDIQDNADKNASDIQQNDDENTQAIIDNQNQIAEQEKQEISSSGNSATDAADTIPNESEGFINALGLFVNTMSTTDTSCSITFPAIKLPSIAGMPAATLSEEREVDFEDAIGLIPNDVMKLVQAFTTIALIVFCFKELYDTISEALTRKKANSDG